MNAEAEKIQKFINYPCGKLDSLLSIDDSVDRILRDIIKKQMILEFKFENILELLSKYSKTRADKAEE